MEFNFLDYTMELGENGNTINLVRFYYKDKKCVLIVPILNVKFVNYSTEAKEFLEMEQLTLDSRILVQLPQYLNCISYFFVNTFYLLQHLPLKGIYFIASVTPNIIRLKHITSTFR